MKPMIRQSREREVGGALAKEKSESMMEKVEEREREKEEHTLRGRVFISCTEPIVAAFSHPSGAYMKLNTFLNGDLVLRV